MGTFNRAQLIKQLGPGPSELERVEEWQQDSSLVPCPIPTYDLFSTPWSVQTTAVVDGSFMQLPFNSIHQSFISQQIDLVSRKISEEQMQFFNHTRRPSKEFGATLINICGIQLQVSVG